MKHLYRFVNEWTIRAPAADVFKRLVDVEAYPLWWRDVREVRQIDDDSGHVKCRAVLPYALDLVLRRAEEDPDAGRMRVDITGDLNGFCGASVTQHGDTTLVRIQQEVVLCKRQLLPVEPVVRPLLRANHGAMMWRGQRGLRRLLDGRA